MTKRNISMTWLALLLTGALVGCVGRERGGADERGADLIESCAGHYTCEWLDDSFDSHPEPYGSACDIGGAVLHPDGSVTFQDGTDGEGFHWTGDSLEFAVCYANTCFTCAADSANREAGEDSEDDDEDCPYECHPETDCSWGYDGDYECEMHEECDYAC